MSTATIPTTGVDGYRSYLIARNGDADLLNRRLSRRDEFFAVIANQPVTSATVIDRQVFLRNLEKRKPEPGLSQQMLFLLATAKLNQAERFGVGLGETYGRNSGASVPVERVYLELEEHYHTRLLAYVLDMFGLPFQTVPPARLLRLLVTAAVFIPRWLAAPFVGAAEMAGCVMFSLLGARGRELFADEPAVAERIGTLYNEILTDEIGHVGYAAASCNRTGRAIMRRLYPLVARFLARTTPELTRVLPRQTLKAHLAAPFDPDTYARHLPTRPFLAKRP